MAGQGKTSTGFSWSLLAGCASLLLATSAASRSLAIDVDRLSTPVAGLDGLSLALDWPQDAARGDLHLTVRALDASEFGYRWRELDWRCELVLGNEDWQCAGPVRARGASGLSLSARLQAGDLLIEASGKGARLGLRQPGGEGEPLRIELARVPAAWLAPLLAMAWEQGHPTGGTVDLDWEMRVDDAGVGFSGPITLAGLGLDSPDGSIATEGLRAAGRVNGEVADAGVALDLNLRFSGGELLFGPLYVALPQTPVELDLRLTSAGQGPWQLQNMRWHDPGVLELDGDARLGIDGGPLVRQMRMNYSMPALGQAHARYFESLTASLGLSGLNVAGAVQGRVELADDAWQSFDAALAGVRLEDGQQRFSLDAVNGELRLRRGAQAAASALAWQRALVYGLAFGPARLSLDSAHGGLALTAPVAVPLFGGQLQVRTLDYRPADGDTRLDLAMALERVDLAALSAAFGWPAFAGTISGDLPGVRLAGNHLDFDGGLSAQLFDGRVAVSQLSMERPFGVAPMLAANIEFSNLDLQPLTQAFDFGEITGRLDGHVRGLRLLDWEPVAFDAAFYTSKRSGVRQRISQRAVNDLTEVGGGGIAAGLQAQVLKAFSSFGYSRIGLSCTLANNVCRMGGVGPAAGGGYIIVDGSGLPRVNVVGHQARVDWPVLLGRLKAATEGQAPVID